MAVYTEKKTYHTKAHMGMIDVTCLLYTSPSPRD